MKSKIQKFELWLGGVVLILMVLVVVLQVIFRYFGNPLSWPEEVARWTMIWVTFAGASYAFKNGGLIRVEFFVNKYFKPGAQKVINIIDMALLAVTFGYLLYSSVLYMMLTIKKASGVQRNADALRGNRCCTCAQRCAVRDILGKADS